MNKQLLNLFKNIKSPHHSGETLLLSTLSILKKSNSNPQKTLLSAIKRLRPGVKILTHIIAGRVIPLPAYRPENSSNYLAIKWLLKAARERTSKSFVVNDLVNEINDTLKNQGRAFKSKIDLIKEIREARVNLRKSYRKFKNKKYGITKTIWNSIPQSTVKLTLKSRRKLTHRNKVKLNVNVKKKLFKTLKK